MKKFDLILIFLFVISYFICFSFYFDNSNTIIDSVNYSIDNLTFDEKIGQMLFVEYRSYDYNDNFYDAIYKYKPGGFILYSENLWGYDEHFELIRKLNMSSDIPLFIGIDQEGGSIQRLIRFDDHMFTSLKSLEDIGNSTKQYAFLSGKVNSDELSAVGINVNFFPVLDIASLKNDRLAFSRSFSSDKNVVAEYGKSYILGLNNGSVVACGKHLPGIGDSTKDTHLDSSYLLKSKKELEEKELVPFKAASKHLDMMMLSHTIIPSITEDLPLTLSKDGIDYLKNYLDYDGLIVSDGLKMKALTLYYSTDEILVESINAGVDVLLAPEKLSVVVPIIKKAVLDGRIKESRIDEAVTKILKVKSKLKKSNYKLTDFYTTYHNLLLKNDYENNYNLIDRHIFNSIDIYK